MMRSMPVLTSAMFGARDETPCNRPDGYRLKVSEHKLVAFAKKRRVYPFDERATGQDTGAMSVPAPAEASS